VRIPSIPSWSGCLLVALVAACRSESTPPPGLWDAHTHISWWGEDALDSLSRYGIVAVRDCGGDVRQLRRLRDAIAAGTRTGPRIFFAGPQIDGPKDNDSLRFTVRTPEEAVKAVDSLAALGVDFIKTHSALSRPAYFAVLREARVKGLKVASHLPAGVPAWEAADSGASSLEHMAESMMTSPMYAGYAKDLDGAIAWWRSPAGDSAVAHLARTGVAVTPTLYAYSVWVDDAKNHADSVGRRDALIFQQELTLRLHRAGVPILAGSDFATRDWIPPGSSLLGEIRMLETAGLTPAEALAAASTNIERWLRQGNRAPAD
jgi:imidazolonepropionase-like amidohydrolase